METSNNADGRHAEYLTAGKTEKKRQDGAEYGTVWLDRPNRVHVTTRVLFSKLAEVTEALQRVPKRGRNDFHKYDYVLEADLMECVRLELAKRKIFIFSAVDSVAREGTLSTIQCTFTFADGDSGETFSIQGAGTGDDKGDKGLYKAITGAVKYMLMKNFLIPTGDDPEGDDGPDRRGHGSAKPKVATPAVRPRIVVPAADAPAEVQAFFALQAKVAAHFAMGPEHYKKLCKLPAGKVPPPLEAIATFTSEGNLKWLGGLNAEMTKALAGSAAPKVAVGADKGGADAL